MQGFFEDPALFEDADWPAGSSEASYASWQVRHTYDVDLMGSGMNYPLGRLTQTEVRSGSGGLHLGKRFRYDCRGNLAELCQTGPVGPARCTQYRYDRQGAVTSVTYPSGLTVDYESDAQGRLRSVQASGR